MNRGGQTEVLQHDLVGHSQQAFRNVGFVGDIQWLADAAELPWHDGLRRSDRAFIRLRKRAKPPGRGNRPGALVHVNDTVSVSRSVLAFRQNLRSVTTK